MYEKRDDEHYEVFAVLDEVHIRDRSGGDYNNGELMTTTVITKNIMVTKIVIVNTILVKIPIVMWNLAKEQQTPNPPPQDPEASPCLAL